MRIEVYHFTQKGILTASTIYTGAELRDIYGKRTAERVLAGKRVKVPYGSMQKRTAWEKK